MVPWNSASGGFAYIWQSKWVGIIAIKNEETQIHFLSDVLVAVASMDLKVLWEREKEARSSPTPHIKVNPPCCPSFEEAFGGGSNLGKMRITLIHPICPNNGDCTVPFCFVLSMHGSIISFMSNTYSLFLWLFALTGRMEQSAVAARQQYQQMSLWCVL